MRSIIATALCLFALACSNSSPTTPTPSPNPTPTPTYTLSGRVTENPFTPIAGATVSISGGPNAGKTEMTDPAGSYSFSELRQSSFTVTVSATGYDTKTANVNLTSNQTLDFELVRSSR